MNTNNNTASTNSNYNMNTLPHNRPEHVVNLITPQNTMSNQTNTQFNDTIVVELTETDISTTLNDEETSASSYEEANTCPPHQAHNIEVIVTGNANIEIVSRRIMLPEDNEETYIDEDPHAVSSTDLESAKDNEDTNTDENAMDQHSVRVGEPNFDELEAIRLDSHIRSQLCIDRSLPKAIQNRILNHHTFTSLIDNLTSEWNSFNQHLTLATTARKSEKTRIHYSAQKSGRKGNSIASRLRSQFGISDELCPNFVLSTGNGRKPPPKKEISASHDVVKATIDTSSICGPFDEELITAVGLSLSGKKKKEFDANISKCINRQNHIKSMVEQSITNKSVVKKLKSVEKITELKRKQNQHIAAIRKKTDISSDVLPNAIVGHGNNLPSRKKELKDIGWVSTIQTDGYDDEDVYIQHSSRRRNCYGCVGQTLNTMNLALNSAKLDHMTVATKFGSNKKFTDSQPDVVLIQCFGQNPCTEKGKCGSPCGVYFCATDPMLLARIEDEESAEECERWLNIVESKRIALLRIKYGPEVFAFCPNHDCSMNQSGFLVQAAVDFKNGIGTEPQKHITCQKCATSWCSCCSMSPYHERKICPGVAYIKGTVEMKLTGADLNQFLKENKACPGCNTLTHKFEACDHMTCKPCSTHWCWRCNGKRDPSNPYVHTCPAGVDYDTGRDPHDRDRH